MLRGVEGLSLFIRIKRSYRNELARILRSTNLLSQGLPQGSTMGCLLQRIRSSLPAKIRKVKFLVKASANIGKMFNLAVSSCSKMLKKMKKGKSPGVSKTRAPTRCSPYKQNVSNISMYQPSFDSGLKKPSSNRNPGIHSKGRK